MSFFALRDVELCQSGISTRKLKIYTVEGFKYCARKRWNTMIIAPGTHKHPSSGANRTSYIAVTMNTNAKFHLTAVNPIMKFFSTDFVPENCHRVESRAVYTGPAFIVESLPGPINRSLPLLQWHMCAEDIITIFITSNIHIRQCHA